MNEKTDIYAAKFQVFRLYKNCYFNFQVSAQQAAERRYRDTLRRAGVEEDFVVRKSSGAGRLQDEEEEADDWQQRSAVYSDHDSDRESYSHSRHSYQSQSRSRSAQRDYSEDFDDRTDEEHSDLDEDR